MNAPKKRKSSIGRTSTAADIIDLDDDGIEKTDDAPFLFVMEVPPSCDEELKNFHETLFGVMEMQNIQPKMISRSEVLSVPRSTPDFYVLPIFEGPEFEYLLRKGCKVIGPFVVDRCIKMGTRLPKWRHPIYALSMEGAVVCFSGLTKRKKAELSELVRRMGGQVSNDLHDKVTVLISKNCNTDYAKYTESAKLKLPILREDWITDSWKSIIDGLTDEPVTSNDFYDNYRVPLFKDMVITVSGLNVNERSNAGNLIELGKGEFTPEMSKTKCTHLITDKNSGDKFKKAREWGNIRIVTLKWLMRSVEMGYVQKESHYDPERVRASTPTKGAKPPDDLDFSMVGPAPAGPGGMNNTTISSGMNSSINTSLRSMMNDITVVKPSFIRHDSSRRVNTADSSTMEEPRIVDATKDIDMAMMNGDEDFFEGLRIFIVGMPDVRETWWKKMLNWSGATRTTRVEMATHIVVVGGVVDKTIVASGKPLLTTEWVVECVKSKKLMPHTDYIYSMAPTVCLNQSLITSVNGPLKTTPAKASQPARKRVTSQQASAAPSISTTSSVVPASSLRRSANVPPPSSSVGVRGIFKGVTFKMNKDFVPEEEKELRAMIAEGGGSVVADSSSAHYLVCTLLDYGTLTPLSQHKTQDIVSVFWLYRCIDSCSLVSPSSHPLFRPLPACRESTLFGGLVVSLVGFDYEQEMYAYESLVLQHGALLSHGGRDKLRVTHTIAGGPTKTTQRAYDPSWIIECIVHDKVLLEDDFVFKSSAYSSYEGRKDDLWEWERCEERRTDSREGTMSGRRIESVVLEDNDMGDGNSMMDMGPFDEDEAVEPMNITEAMEEEDSMVREITEEMEMEGRASARTQQLPSSVSSPIVSASTPRGRSAATPGGITHPRLQMLRTVPTASSPSNRIIPTTSSPTQFLHKDAKPKLVIPGVEEYLEDISSCAHSDMDRSIDQLSASGVGRMLDGMVVTTGRMNNEMMETPIRGTSVLEEREERDTEMLMNRRASTGVRRNLLESARLERRDETIDGEVNQTMDVDDDSPRDSGVVLPPELERRKKELALQMAAATLASKKKEEEKASTTSTSGATTSGEKEGGTSERRSGGTHGGLTLAGGGRSRRKRLNLADIIGSEAKRVPPSSPPQEDKTAVLPVPVAIGWDAAPLEYNDDVDADHSRILDSPIKPIRRDPTMPSTSTFVHRNMMGSKSMAASKSTVADQSMAGNKHRSMAANKSTVADRSMDGNKSIPADRTLPERTEKSACTPATSKTLRARPPPPMDDKTQEVTRAGGGGGEVVGEKSARKAKSTAAISRRGRGKENEEKGRVFAFTSVDVEMRDRLTEAVRTLGGSVSYSDTYDATVTHVVCGKMIRNEKMLGAMVSGNFIVMPSYVLDSLRDNKWVTEGEYEWCNNTQDMEEKDRRVADSISRWKREVQAQRSTLLVEGREGKVGAFIEWRVVFYALTRVKTDQLMRILQAGGGEAVFRDDVEREDIERLQPTHVLVDGTMMEPVGKWDLEELRFVHYLGAGAFPIDFLYKWLTTERMNVPNHYLPEYKKLLI